MQLMNFAHSLAWLGPQEIWPALCDRHAKFTLQHLVHKLSENHWQSLLEPLKHSNDDDIAKTARRPRVWELLCTGGNFIQWRDALANNGDQQNLPLNQKLPLYLQNPTAGLQAVKPLANPDTDLQTIHHAIAELGSHHAACVRFIRLFCQELVIREELHQSAIARSASSPRAPGRVVIINLAKMHEQAHLQECVIHESIHAALTVCELDSPLCDAALADQPTISPWTGSHIPLLALIHACFVWFGLLHFHLLNPAPSPWVESRIRFIQQGFNKLNLDHFDNSHEHAVHTIRYLKESAQ